MDQEASAALPQSEARANRPDRGEIARRPWNGRAGRGRRTHEGWRREARSNRGRNGRCTSSTSLGRKETLSPGLLLDSGLYEGEPETCRRSLRPFVRNFLYLALLLAVFKVYRIEERAFQGRAFQMLVTLALAALPVHYMAPFRWKKPLFVAISILGLFCVCGTQVAAIVLGLATVLIGICFLPIPWIAQGRAAWGP